MNTDTGTTTHHGGLRQDLAAISRLDMQRRRLLGLLAGGGTLALLPGCGGSDETAIAGETTSGGSTTGSTSSSNVSSTSCVADPTETNGPYPSDGSNTANGAISNVLIQSGVVRSDIRSSFGTSSGVAPGVPLALNIRVVNSNSACSPLAGYAIYIWHCTRDGLYSLYSNGAQTENFLRGVQVTDSNGWVTFTTVFPGCYAGRYPHIHFEVFTSQNTATGYANRALVSQMALPAAACSAVYSTATGYGSSLTNLAGVSLTTDGIFRDNSAAEIAQQTISLTGDPTGGYTGEILVGVPG